MMPPPEGYGGTEQQNTFPREEQYFMLELEHIQKSFDGVPVLKDISLQVADGEIVSILGPSGCGKTTLLNLILGIVDADSGRICYDGQDLTHTPMEKRGFNIVFQDYALFPNLNVLQNITYGLRNKPGVSTKEEVEELIDLLGLREHLSKRIDQLSGGQKQRVAIARALATDPKVLLCDEATSALDPTTTNSILALLKELNQKLGVTVVIITHQMSVIEEICTRVAILDGGEVAEEGRVEDIFAHPATDAARRLVYPGGVSAKQYPAGTRAVRVSFNGGTVYDPLIASLAIDCGVKVTILGADTRTIDGKAFGTMLLLLPDDPNEAAKALSYIRSQPNITAEEVEYHA